MNSPFCSCPQWKEGANGQLIQTGSQGYQQSQGSSEPSPDCPSCGNHISHTCKTYYWCDRCGAIQSGGGQEGWFLYQPKLTKEMAGTLMDKEMQDAVRDHQRAAKRMADAKAKMDKKLGKKL